VPMPSVYGRHPTAARERDAAAVSHEDERGNEA